jgi:hypothetical protein
VKITKLSLAAIAAMTLTTGAMADEGIDFKIDGQAVVYYQTMDGDNIDQFNKDGSKANAGLQLDLSSNLGNGFGLGLQGSALNTLGLEDNLVSATMQGGGGDTGNASNYFAMTKAYITKKAGNTLIKAGRQELPKSLSPFAFSESWNVFKNTFDAAVLINSDIPNTTLVGAYVDRSNMNGAFGDLSEFGDMAGGAINNGAYMLTAQNKSLEGLTVTGSYYAIPSSTGTAAVDAVVTTDSNGDTTVVTPAVAATGGLGHVDVLWLDTKVDLNKLAQLPVNLALQGGQMEIDGEDNPTQAIGVKASAKVSGTNLSLAYTKVSTDGTLGITNVGTGVKSPLYTQMILNQGKIAKGNDTVVLKAVIPAGPGKVVAQYGMTTDNTTTGNDYQELDLMYKFKAFDMNMFAAYVMQTQDDIGLGADKANDQANLIRFWTRYNF